jgi:nucleotide-binding universal stress UspA family protein
MAKRKAETTEYMPLKGAVKPESPKSRTRSTGHLLWAIDPVEHDVRHVRPVLDLLELWSRQTGTTIRPISVLSPLNLNWPAELIKPLRAKLSSISDRTVVPLIKRLRPGDESLAPTLLIQPVASVRQAVRTIVDYAKKEKAELIAVNTHGKHGLKKFFIGSFSETLIAYSPVPVLTLNPNTKAPKKITTILFPADLSREVHEAFLKTVTLAKNFDAKIILYHAYQDPTQYAAYTEWDLGIDPVLIQKIWADTEVAKRREGDAWAAQAKRHGVRCEFVFQKQSEKQPKNPADAILAAAKKHRPNLIAVATTMTPFGQAVLGGTVKSVIAKSAQPVLVLRAR